VFLANLEKLMCLLRVSRNIKLKLPKGESEEVCEILNGY